jgi:UDP-glucose:(glucosyl)LPS alpha-1,2-glucosyltransferase
MSALVKGKISDTNLSRNARGGTEQMRDRLLLNVRPDLLNNIVIHFSRVRPENMVDGVANIFFAHDLVDDPESRVLADGGYRKFAKIVFVSYWQRDQYMLVYGIPYSHCTVIENAIEREFIARNKSNETVNFIYHTTPHRGLQLLHPVFDALTKDYKNIHLDVFSSFGVYGWKERDAAYAGVFDALKKHPNITYHGAKSNQEVLAALDKAHVFLYPCIWQETSCIAMIEAIKSGVLAIHPSLAALPETASECTLMYDYTEDKQLHMERAYKAAKTVLDNGGVDFVNRIMCDAKCELPRNSIDAFTSKWNTLLNQVTR